MIIIIPLTIYLHLYLSLYHLYLAFEIAALDGIGSTSPRQRIAAQFKAFPQIVVHVRAHRFGVVVCL